MTTAQKIELVAAVTRNRAIGLRGDVVWRNKTDLAFIREHTLGCPVVMGRKTWQALPAHVRPLPGRHNIVVSRNADFAASGADVVPSLQAALALVPSAPRVCIFGGAQLYALALPMATTLVLTEVDAELEGDTFFPEWDHRAFAETWREDHVSEKGVAFAFVKYQRI